MIALQSFSVKVIETAHTRRWLRGNPGSSNRFDKGRSYPVIGTSLEAGVYKFCVVNNAGSFEWIEYHHFAVDFNSNETLRAWLKDNKDVLELPASQYPEHTDVKKTDVTPEGIKVEFDPASTSPESGTPFRESIEMEDEGPNEVSSSPAKKRGRPSKKVSE